MRITDHADKNKEQLKWFPYVWFLLFPLITLVLLQTAPWQEDNSECKPDRTRPRFQENSANVSHGENAVLPRGSIVLPTGSIVFEMQKCTCSADVPAFLYMLVIFECFVFMYFTAFDPLNTLLSRPYEEVEDWRYNYRIPLIGIFDALYISLLVAELNGLLQSDVDCSFAIWVFGILFFILRSTVIILLNSLLCIPQKQTVTLDL
jgi:hypothetical protein